MKIEVYTAAIGTPERPRDPSILVPGVRYACATDVECDSEVWERLVFDTGSDPVRTARRFKLMLHEHAHVFGADLYVWIDAPFRLDVDPEIFAEKLLRCDVLVFRHPWRETIEQEAEELAHKGLAPASAMQAQIARYRHEKFPADWPLASTGFMVRRNDKRTQMMNRIWYSELVEYGHNRDQISFDYAAWRAGMTIGYLEGTYIDNPYSLWGQEAA